MTLRLANIDDIPALITLQNNIIEFERSFDPGIRDNAIYYPEAKLKDIIEGNDGRIVVVDSEGQLKGCGFGTIVDASGWDAYDKKGYVGMMYVDPSLRGQGYGKKIMKNLLDWFTEREILDVQLNVYPQNINAIELYKSFGFTEHLMFMRKLK